MPGSASSSVGKSNCSRDGCRSRRFKSFLALYYQNKGGCWWMNEDVFKDMVCQLRRIADSLEVMTAVPKIDATPEQIKDLEKALKQEPLSIVEGNKGSHQDIVDVWNAELVPLGIPKINSIRNNRAGMVSARIREYGKESFFKCIEEVKQSSFLQGKTKKPWTGFNFDWLICPSNFPKVLEGNYNDNRKVGQEQPAASSALPLDWLK